MIVSLEPELLAQLARLDTRTDAATAENLDGELAATVRRAARMRRLFYTVVLVVALYGAATGAVATFGLPWWVAVGGVVALELGGVVFLTDADTRRRLGEHAHLSRLVGAVIAVAAATFNAATHDSPLLGGFFALMSGLGFVSWWIDVENQRRDRLRARGQLPPPTPKYELWAHSMRHPIVTARARSLAKMYPELGLYGSLEAAVMVRKREQRNAALADVLRARIRGAVGDDLATVATLTFDIDEIARRLSAEPDYDAMTAVLATELTAERILQGRNDRLTGAIHDHPGPSRRSTAPASSTTRTGGSRHDSVHAGQRARRIASRPSVGVRFSRVTVRRRSSSPTAKHQPPSSMPAARVLDAPPAVAVHAAGSPPAIDGFSGADGSAATEPDRHAGGNDPNGRTVRVQMIDGPIIVDNDGQPVRGLRSKSLELLAFLVVHRSGAAITEILDAIWHDVPPDRASQRLSTVVSNLRTVMRNVLRAGTPIPGDAAAMPEPIINTGGRYQLNSAVVVVDCWDIVDEST